MQNSLLTLSIVTAVAGFSLLGCSGTTKSEGFARDFEATTMGGAEISGETLLGQVTIIDFWAVF